MKKHFFTATIITAVLVIYSFTFPAQSVAGVNVNIAVPLPGLVIPAPPPMTVIPGTYVYYPPDVSAEIYFYQGYWYRPYEGRWYLATGYNGPWRGIAIGRVPRPLLSLPPHYRTMPGYERVPYADVKRNWRGWERNRHWDRPAEHREHREERH